MSSSRFFALQKTTLIDFPGEVATVIFFRGCNFRCPFCHNKDLLSNEKQDDFISEEELFSFLTKRAAVLGGAVLSGGEPLLASLDYLKKFIKKIKDLGLKVKIDTNGTFPEKIKELNADYIAMDVKTTLAKYPQMKYSDPDLTGKIKQTIQYIIQSGIPHEFRTTAVPGIVEFEDLTEIAEMVKGCDKYYINRFRPAVTLDPAYEELPPHPDGLLEDMKQFLIDQGIPAEVR